MNIEENNTQYLLVLINHSRRDFLFDDLVKSADATNIRN
jgi:hypothetical protein